MDEARGIPANNLQRATSVSARWQGGTPCLSLNQLVGLPSVYAGRWYDVDYSFSGGRVVERLAFERMVIVERSQSRVRRI